MSVSESTITNPKRQLEFYRDLSEELQQKNKELENINDKLSSALNSAEQRIDKAIEYIKKLGYLAELSKDSFIVEERERKELLSILKGEDKE